MGYIAIKYNQLHCSLCGIHPMPINPRLQMQAIGLSTDKTTAVLAPNTIYLVKL